MTNLQEITKSLGTFTVSNKNNADLIIQQYEKAGLTTSAKLAKIAQHGFTFFEKEDLMNFALNAVQPYLEQDEFETDEKLKRYGANFSQYFIQTKIGEKVDLLKRTDRDNELFAIVISPIEPNDSYGFNNLLNSYKPKAPVTVTIDEVNSYPHTPPINTVEVIAKAKDLNVFDKMFVLDIETEKQSILKIVDPEKEALKARLQSMENNINNMARQQIAQTRIVEVTRYIDDPIVVGWIQEKPDTYFYITAWDKNVKFSEILNQEICLPNPPKLIK